MLSVLDQQGGRVRANIDRNDSFDTRPALRYSLMIFYTERKHRFFIKMFQIILL